MHHNDAPDLDPRTDIADLYVFQSPDDPQKSILILNVNPKASAGAFDPQASYELKIDTDGDFEADAAFHILFTWPDARGGQQADVYRAAGPAARDTGAVGEVVIRDAPVSFTRDVCITAAGEYRFFAGLRSEPFFADPEGFVNNLQWTGRDGWAGYNIFGIVLEAPNRALSSQPRVGIWGRTMAPVHGVLSPVNQMGRPGNNVFRQGADTNTTPPARQRDRYLLQYEALFRGYGYSEGDAAALALEWCPDVLPYEYTSAAGYPNGRRLTDDIVDNAVEILTRGRMRDDLVHPHTDYLAEFPFLGTPNP